MTAWPKPIPSPPLRVKIEHLDQDTFAPFGTVIQNPGHASGRPSQQRLKVIEANQGSALKYIDVSHLTNHYASAPSKKPAKAVMNMFVCKPRKLRRRRAGSAIVTDQVVGSEVEHVFDVGILERHPFTPQTFVPVGLGKGDMKTKYLVVVAPTAPDPSPKSRMTSKFLSILSPWSSPASESNTDSSAPSPKGPGLPDLSNLRAFLADGSQAVTYGPGTWHAPMVVLGERPIDFVVVQYANGVGDEDCQEVLLQNEDGKGVSVVVEIIPESPTPVRAKL